MTEERRTILQMVADGKITADQGAGLLEALEKGERKRRDDSSPAMKARERKRILSERLRSGEAGGLEGLRDIGRMVRSMIRESAAGMEDDGFSPEEDEFLNGSEELLEGPLDLERGTRLVVRRGPAGNSSGDVYLTGAGGSALERTEEDSSDVRYRREGDTVYLRWRSGDLHLAVPETADRIMLRLAGGNAFISGVASSVKARTKGGNATLDGISRDFSVKTLGGNVTIRLPEEWRGNSKASVMGGRLSLELSRNTRARIYARAMGGEVSVPEDIQAEHEAGHPGSSEVNIDLSSGEESSDLALRAMGGDICVGLSSD
ncbi:MAG: hypothetical protein R6U39_01080 [Candidatus Aegiribacteria sp.]